MSKNIRLVKFVISPLYQIWVEGANKKVRLVVLHQQKVGLTVGDKVSAANFFCLEKDRLFKGTAIA